jgi:hypothetical protein
MACADSIDAQAEFEEWATLFVSFGVPEAEVAQVRPVPTRRALLLKSQF